MLLDLLVVEEPEVSVLDLLSDDAVDFESALAPSFAPVLADPVLASDVDLASAGDSFELDSDDVAFFRASDG